MSDASRQHHPAPSRPTISLTPALRSPGKLLHDAHKHLSSGLVRALAEVGYQLPIEAWAILNVLWEEDDLPQSEVGARICRDRHQTSRLIDHLCRLHLVTRESIPEDRRVKRVVLTDEGHAAKTPLRRVATEYFAHTFQGVTQEEYDSCIRCLEHIIARHTQSS